MSRKWIALALVCCAVSASAVEVTLKDTDVRLQIYGYVRADLAHDTQATAPKADFAFWVLPEVAGEKDGQTHLGARETRLGLNLIGPEIGNWKSSGKLEMDFYGAGNPNSYSPRMRLAYLDLAHTGAFRCASARTGTRSARWCRGS
jgi:hypothetical protein